MKKSKQKNLLDVLLMGAAALFGALTLIIMVAPGILYDLGLLGTAKYSVYDLLNYGDTLRVGILLALIFAILFVVCVLLLLVLKLLGKKLKAEGLISLCAAGLEIAAGILFFFSKSLAGESGNGLVSLGVGAVLAGIFAIIAACSLGICIIKKLVK